MVDSSSPSVAFGPSQDFLKPCLPRTWMIMGAGACLGACLTSTAVDTVLRSVGFLLVVFRGRFQKLSLVLRTKD
jgi:hypothetical protein